MTSWHYMKNGTQTGPVSTEEILAQLSSGALSGDTLVWRDGLAIWAAAKTQPEFASAVPPAAAGGSGGPIAVDAADVEKNKVFAILAYLPPLLFLVPLLAARESKFAMYHGNEGLVLTLAAIAVWMVKLMLVFCLMFIPVLGWMLILLLNLATFVAIVGLAVLGIINAANGVCKPLPVIGGRFTLVK